MSKFPLSLLKSKFFYVSISLLIACGVGCSSCTLFTKTTKQLQELSTEIGNTTFQKVKLTDGKFVRTLFTKLDETEKPVLVLVHGAPGGVDGFKDMHKNKELLERYNILSYDRPGYGKGTKEDYKSVTSLEKQASILRQVLVHFKIENPVLFSHSFGGAVALSYAVNYKVKGVLLASVAVDPENEKIFWFAHLGKWKATRWMLAKALKTSADEKFSHIEELKKLEKKLVEVNTKIIAIHGDEDSLVPYENLDYIKRKLAHCDLELVTIKGENHFYPFSKPEVCTQKLLEF